MGLSGRRRSAESGICGELIWSSAAKTRSGGVISFQETWRFSDEWGSPFAHICRDTFCLSWRTELVGHVLRECAKCQRFSFKFVVRVDHFGERMCVCL